MELGDLLPELLEHILSFVPLKSLTGLKCVSKTWYKLITQLRQSTPQTTSYGLVLSLEPRQPSIDQSICSKTTFITVKDHGIEGVEQTSLSISFPGVTLINSCNGLLLYAVKDRNYYTEFFVCSPITKQYIAIPRIHKVSTQAFVGIAFDGLQQNFKLICYDTNEINFVDIPRKRKIILVDETIICHIFSSETGEWKIHRARLVNSSLSSLIRFNCGASLYFEGKVYCISLNRLVVYDVKRNRFKLYFVLPFIEQFYPKLLWKSEGRIHYCCQYGKRGCNIFKICAYVNIGDDDDDDYHTNNGHEYYLYKDKMEGLCKDLVQTKKALQGIPSRGLDDVKPVSFNDDLQILYLQISDIVFAYSLETQRLTKVWYDPSPDETNQHVIFPFLFKPVDLSQISGCQPLSTLTTSK